MDELLDWLRFMLLLIVFTAAISLAFWVISKGPDIEARGVRAVLLEVWEGPGP